MYQCVWTVIWTLTQCFIQLNTFQCTHTLNHVWVNHLASGQLCFVHLLVFVLRNGIDIVRPYYLCIQHIYGNSKYLFYAQPIVNILFTNLTWKCPVNLPHQSHHCSVWLCQTQSQRPSPCSLQPSVLGRHYASRHRLCRVSQEVAHLAVQCICDQVYYDITIL